MKPAHMTPAPIETLERRVQRFAGFRFFISSNALAVKKDGRVLSAHEHQMQRCSNSDGPVMTMNPAQSDR